MAGCVFTETRPKPGTFQADGVTLGEKKPLASPSLTGSIVLLAQITITMASLCQESGRQKAGNGLESRKGSRAACGGERSEKGCVCVSRLGGGVQADIYCGVFTKTSRALAVSEDGCVCR